MGIESNREGMTLEELGFTYTGRCACAGKPDKWIAEKRLELKKWSDGRWKLLRSGYLVRYGNSPESIATETKEYMEKNNLI
jgi:hypothetical protein